MKELREDLRRLGIGLAIVVLVLVLWLVLTALPGASGVLWGWDAPLVGAVGILSVWGAGQGLLALSAYRPVVYATLVAIAAFAMMIVTLLLTLITHPTLLDQSGPAAMVLLLPVLVTIGAAGLGVALAWIKTLIL